MKTNPPSEYEKEFPDFGQLPDLIADRLASGQLVDLSWSQDLCPSFTTPRGDDLLTITGDQESVPVLWIDYQRPEDREMPEASRFGVAFAGDFFAFDDEAQALARLDELSAGLVVPCVTDDERSNGPRR